MFVKNDVWLNDLDGVYGDFSKAACELHGRPGHVVDKWDWYNDWGMSGNEFWKPIKEYGFEFYDHVQPYPWFDDLLAIFDGRKIVIATANPLHDGLAASKTRWIIKYFGAKANVMVGKEKELMAAPGRCLLDDCNENIQSFTKFGGNGILFPQPWNNAKDLVADRVSYVRDQVAYYAGEQVLQMR